MAYLIVYITLIDHALVKYNMLFTYINTYSNYNILYNIVSV